MNTTFNVNEYWLRRGRTYSKETRTPPEFHRLQEQFLLDVLRHGEIPMRRVLEIGCGFGRITRLLAETWPDAEITALDLSTDQLANARRYCGENPRIRFQQYDFYSGAPFPGSDYDAMVAIEVFLHHPPKVVLDLMKRLLLVGRHIVNIDWSEDWRLPTATHVWVHDYAKLYAEGGISCAVFPLPEKIDGKQQKLFVAARKLPVPLKALERQLAKPSHASSAETQPLDDWSHQVSQAGAELRAIIPPGATIILVDDAQWGVPQDWNGWHVIPFLEKDGVYWGPPDNDATAWRELNRLQRSGAKFLVFASPAFWGLEHYAGFQRRIRAKFPCALENERLVVFRLAD